MLNEKYLVSTTYRSINQYVIRHCECSICQRGNNWRRDTPPDRGVASRRCYLFKQRCVYSPHCVIDCLESYCTIRPSFGSLRVCFFAISYQSRDNWISGKLWTCLQKNLSFSTEECACLKLCFDLSYFLYSLYKFHVGISFNAVNSFEKNLSKFKFLPCLLIHHVMKLNGEASQAGAILPFWLPRPPLWFSGQSSRLQILRSRFRFSVLQDFLKSSVGLERGPLSLVRITEELLEWESSGSGQENRINGQGIRWADQATPSIRKKLALTSPTSGGRSVGVVHLRTKGHGV
jgi:hypothetical protein